MIKLLLCTSFSRKTQITQHIVKTGNDSVAKTEDRKQTKNAIDARKVIQSGNSDASENDIAANAI